MTSLPGAAETWTMLIQVFLRRIRICPVDNVRSSGLLTNTIIRTRQHRNSPHPTVT